MIIGLACLACIAALVVLGVWYARLLHHIDELESSIGLENRALDSAAGRIEALEHAREFQERFISQLYTQLIEIKTKKGAP